MSRTINPRAQIPSPTYQPFGIKRYVSKPGVFISASAVAAGFSNRALSTNTGPNGLPLPSQISKVPAKRMRRIA
jgi:hypothetical protein